MEGTGRQKETADRRQRTGAIGTENGREGRAAHGGSTYPRIQLHSVTLFHESTDRIALIARRVKLPRPPLIDESARVLAASTDAEKVRGSERESERERGGAKREIEREEAPKGRGTALCPPLYTARVSTKCQVFSARFASNDAPLATVDQRNSPSRCIKMHKE